MNRLARLIALTMLGALCASEVRLNSQEIAVVRQSPLAALASLKASNAELLKNQQQTLKKLEELKLQAEQLRVMAKRS